MLVKVIITKLFQKIKSMAVATESGETTRISEGEQRKKFLETS